MGKAFPGSIPIANGVLDRLAAALEVAVSHRRVQIERAILDVVIQLHVVRALIDLFGGAAPHIGADRSDEPREWIHERVGGEPERVTHVQRGQQRHYQVRPGPNAVEGKGLSGVRVSLLDTQARGDVKESHDADGRVDYKARELQASGGQPALQNLVHEPLWHIQVVEGVGQTLSELLWQSRPN